MLAGSILILSSAVMLGAGHLAQAIAISGHWDDTPVSMSIVGGIFGVSGLAVLIGGIFLDDATQRRQTAALSGSILILSAAVVFAFGKIALTVATLAGQPERPILLLAIGSSFSLFGLALVLRYIFWEQPPHDRADCR